MYLLPQYQELNIIGFQNMLDYKNLTNSYKIYWLYAVLHEVKLGNTVLSFNNLALRMITKSWYSITQFKLNFGQQDDLGKIVLAIYQDYSLTSNIKEHDLYDFLLSIKDNKDIKQYIKKLCKYVPYRLIRSFYCFKAEDYKVNKIIEKLSNESDIALYKVSKEKKEINIHKHWCNYITKNQTIIDGWLKYKLIYFLQKRNPNSPAILHKLEAPQTRNLTKAKEYWNQIMSITNINDIYTGLPFTDEYVAQHGSISLDHFIPWSFVLHDEVWNLVPTFKNINSAKNDKLPSLDKYLNTFCDIQYQGLKTAINFYIKSKAKENFYNVHSDLLNKELLCNDTQYKKLFFDSMRQTIAPLHQLALNQGFIETC
ncbi:HNH endonuclease [Clostridium sp. 'deep sea']|uniref:HNH endonuclease domain-containing protein n=1 Tax=Clostridium sp. 'deep sea' TaxID=2779445 RepID=UPI0018966EB7|nr:HNH endonuclease domain-containing protein [Clostridium sp. 'deep sea']QOR35072.1 HNH endonuclease [Clostridium sp. 'deep sea']